MNAPRRWLPAWGTCAVLAWLVPAGCSDQAAVDGQMEIAGELRALRLALREPEKAAAAAPAWDHAAITAALAPLQEVLDRLASEQQELHARQLALAQELQRWSQLLAQSVTGNQRAETEALTARLQHLEATLQEQDARHREVEKLMGGALDRTADRLEQFLQRLESVPPGAGSAAPESPPAGGAVPTKAGAPAGSEPANGGPARTGALDLRSGEPRLGGSRRNPTAWWLGLFGVAAAVGAVFAWRLRRSRFEGAALPVDHGRAGAGGGVDPGVQELWAAAALLGDAVDRLRQAGREPQPGTDEGIGLDEVFVLDEGEPAPGPSAAPAQDAQPPAAAPPTIRLLLPTADPAAIAKVLRLLGNDARVLRRPAPRAAPQGPGIEVVFAVLPDLSAGERSHLERLVRDAV